MPLKSYLIGPFESGLVNNIEPWLLPEDAFQFLTNAYVWRGRIRKRFGYSLLGGTAISSRFRINIATTDAGTGDLTAQPLPGDKFEIGQQFSIGSTIFTVKELGAAADLLSTGTATGTINTTVTPATITIVGMNENPSTSVYYYPADPVMGLLVREAATINQERIIGFDTQFAYKRESGSWEQLGTAVWTGNNSDFYWSVNYRGTNAYETFFYVVNGIADDNIRYVKQTPDTWVTLRPKLDSGSNPATDRYLETAKIIIGFKDRLVVLNTIESLGGSSNSYLNRARWSQNGDPTVEATSWLDDTPGKGGYIDASTQEAIITCKFIKDRLIVYFERSTWELVYTGNAVLPFTWQQLNTELGAESRFSIIGFDKGAVGVGNVGIHTCNGVSVERIDQKIPNEVFKIHNENNGTERVYGTRDFYRELVYWTFPDAASNPTFPTKVLVWNYQNNSWAFFEDSFTCFGKFQKDSDLTWANVGGRFKSWEVWNAPWGGAQAQSQFPDIVAGNQQGFVLVIEPDSSANSASLSITDMDTATQQMTIINHNLKNNDFLQIQNAQGITLAPNTATSQDITVFKVKVESADTISIDNGGTVIDRTAFSWTGTYTGAGTLTRISNLDITSKQWNPGTPVGQQFRMPYMDFLLDRTKDGEVSVNYFIDSTQGNSIQEQAQNNGAILGSNTLYTKAEDNAVYQPNQVRVWHRYFLQSQGMMIQIKIFMSDDQMRDLDISQSDFQLDGIIIYAEPSGRITG